MAATADKRAGGDVRVAVIGAGRWGQNLVRNFYALGALAAVVDTDATARERAATELAPGVPAYADAEAVLRNAAIDAVVLATPAPHHATDALTAIAAGKDVLVEKPMALNVADAQRMTDAAAASERILMVGHLLLYQPAIAWLRDTIAAGTLGDIWHVQTERLNLGTVRRVEDVLWSFAPHDLAVIRVLLGEPKLTSVTAAATARVQAQIADDVHAHYRFAGGASAHVHAAWYWPKKIRTTTVIGSLGAVIYDEVAQTVMHYPQVIDPDTLVARRGEAVAIDIADAEPLRLECQHFLDCVANRTTPLSGGAHGVEVVRMLEQASAQLKELA